MSFKDFLKENEDKIHDPFTIKFLTEHDNVYDPSTNVCPTCGGKITGRCRCMIGSRTCENGHEWYIDNGFVIEGDGHGGKVGIKLMRSK